MGKKRMVVFLALTMAIVMSAGLGYFIGSSAGYNRALGGYVYLLDLYRREPYVKLFVDSDGMIRHMNESGLDGLIDALESKYDTLDRFLDGVQPLAEGDEKVRISRALGAWEAARKKLEELRSSPKAGGDPNTAGR